MTMRRERRYWAREVISLVPRLIFSSGTYSGIAKVGPTGIVCDLAMPLRTYEKEPGDEAKKW